MTLFSKRLATLCSVIMLASALTTAGKQTKKACSDDFFKTRTSCNGQTELINSANKHAIPPAAKDYSELTSASYTREHTHINHPSGTSLFPNNRALSGSFSTFLSNIEKKPFFIVYFARFHIQVLHELYVYLTKIFTTMNTSNVTGISQYLTNEQTFALNKKTLIINHLVNIIEEQNNQAILARFPALPQHIATYAGTLLMKHDYGTDLNLMLQDAELTLFTDDTSRAMIRDMRSDYLNLFGQYLSFFNQYTADIDKENKAKGYVGISDFARNAQIIQAAIAKEAATFNPKLDPAARRTAIQSITTINPPMFFYNAETLRGLKIIPQLAKALPKNVQTIGWPKTIVERAKDDEKLTPKYSSLSKTSQFPIAFFRNETGEITTNEQEAKRLFLNIPIASAGGLKNQDANIYMQELLKQPPWLNSKEGIIKMLRVCLGDFYSILDPIFKDEEIFDPCILCIIKNAATKVSLSVPGGTECTDCQTFIEALTDAINQREEELGGGNLPPLDETDDDEWYNIGTGE